MSTQVAEAKDPVLEVTVTSPRSFKIEGWTMYSAPAILRRVTYAVHQLRPPIEGALAAMVYCPGIETEPAPKARNDYALTFKGGPYTTGRLVEYPLKRDRSVAFLFAWREGDAPKAVRTVLFVKGRHSKRIFPRVFGWLAGEFASFAAVVGAKK